MELNVNLIGLPWKLGEDGKAKRFENYPLDNVYENSFEVKNGKIPGNCRDITNIISKKLDSDIERVGDDSIKPILGLIDSRTGKLVIEDGNHYQKRLRKLGIKILPSIYIGDADFADEKVAWEWFCKCSTTLNRSNLTYPQFMRVCSIFREHEGRNWRKSIEELTGIKSGKASSALTYYDDVIELGIFDNIINEDYNENYVRALIKIRRDEILNEGKGGHTSPKTPEEIATIELSSAFKIKKSLEKEIRMIIDSGAINNVKKSKDMIKQLYSKVIILDESDEYLDDEQTKQYRKFKREMNISSEFFISTKREIDEVCNTINDNLIQTTLTDFKEQEIIKTDTKEQQENKHAPINIKRVDVNKESKSNIIYDMMEEEGYKEKFNKSSTINDEFVDYERKGKQLS